MQRIRLKNILLIAFTSLTENLHRLPFQGFLV